MEQGLKTLLPDLAGIIVLVFLGAVSVMLARQFKGQGMSRMPRVFAKPAALLVLAIPHIGLLFAAMRFAFPLETFLYFIVVGQALTAFTDSW